MRIPVEITPVKVIKIINNILSRFIEALNQGYKVIFTTMGDLVHVLKTEEITRKSQTRMKRIRDADLVIIDDLMFMAMDQQEANMFFHLINELYN
ncbi:hypothetical protein J32TS6_42460 [Virgibacillus pantothenticus]|nr:hypothetical protein J32TS6_42460 [Virgibacillus pantothenticus]SIT10620.1 IstB-like ATP binding protein [Virgibacillus pantothenticus]